MVAGDAALSTGARGGVVLADGILPELRALLPASAFLARFTDKDRMRSYVETIPIRIVVSPDAGLLGAARLLWRGTA